MGRAETVGARKFGMKKGGEMSENQAKMTSWEAAALYPRPKRKPGDSDLDYARKLYRVYRQRSDAMGISPTFFHLSALMDLAAWTSIRGRYTQAKSWRAYEAVKEGLFIDWAAGKLSTQRRRNDHRQGS